MSPDRSAPRLLGPGRFITRAVFDHADGTHTVVGSRQFRKGIPSHRAPNSRDHLIPHSTLRAIMKIRLTTTTEWIAVLFIVGSACFLVAGLQAAFPGHGIELLRSTKSQNVTFFIGSIFFTSAAGLQLRESILSDLRNCHLETGPNKWWDWRPRDCGYMASLTQFIGTILFNLNTGIPLVFDGSWLAEDFEIWTPNFAGSILFLVSSVYGCIEVGQRLFSFEPRNFSWWVAQCNLGGSILFQASAFLSIALPFALPAWIGVDASLCTALGGVGFLLAAALMLPEQADEPIHPEW